MKFLAISVCMFVLLSVCKSSPQMSDAELEQTLRDKNLMLKHLKCATGEGPCDAVGRRLRTVAPLVLRGACPQCSAKEVRQIRRTLAYVQRNYPKAWAKIVRQYG
nr:Ejaculatory bulb-specific protein 3 [Metisa plana]